MRGCPYSVYSVYGVKPLGENGTPKLYFLRIYSMVYWHILTLPYLNGCNFTSLHMAPCGREVSQHWQRTQVMAKARYDFPM
jgi:hypothetical protein